MRLPWSLGAQSPRLSDIETLLDTLSNSVPVFCGESKQKYKNTKMLSLRALVSLLLLAAVRLCCEAVDGAAMMVEDSMIEAKEQARRQQKAAAAENDDWEILDDLVPPPPPRNDRMAEAFASAEEPRSPEFIAPVWGREEEVHALVPIKVKPVDVGAAPAEEPSSVRVVLSPRRGGAVDLARPATARFANPRSQLFFDSRWEAGDGDTTPVAWQLTYDHDYADVERQRQQRQHRQQQQDQDQQQQQQQQQEQQYTRPQLMASESTAEVAEPRRPQSEEQVSRPKCGGKRAFLAAAVVGAAAVTGLSTGCSGFISDLFHPPKRRYERIERSATVESWLLGGAKLKAKVAWEREIVTEYITKAAQKESLPSPQGEWRKKHSLEHRPERVGTVPKAEEEKEKRDWYLDE